jgi:hypothetical protein
MGMGWENKPKRFLVVFIPLVDHITVPSTFSYANKVVGYTNQSINTGSV